MHDVFRGSRMFSSSSAKDMRSPAQQHDHSPPALMSSHPWHERLFVFLGFYVFLHATPRHFTGHPRLCLCVCDYIYFLTTTSRVGSSEQLSVGPRDQSEAPISPTATTVDAAGQREGSGLTSCHTDPASRGQTPGPWATVSHCVSFQPSRSHRAA